MHVRSSRRPLLLPHQRSLLLLLLALPLSSSGCSDAGFTVASPLESDDSGAVGLDSADEGGGPGADSRPGESDSGAPYDAGEAGGEDSVVASDSTTPDTTDVATAVDTTPPCKTFCIYAPTAPNRLVGEACATNSDCCSGDCAPGGKCQPPEGACAGCWCGGEMEWCSTTAGVVCK